MTSPKITVELTPFDIKQDLNDLGLSIDAKGDAGLNLPSSDAQSLSSAEIKILQAIKHYHDDTIQSSNRHLLEREIQDANSLRQADGHDGQVSSLKIDLTSEYASHIDNVEDANRQYKKDKHTLDFFRKENDIVDDAKLRSLKGKFLFILAVFILFAIEVSTNTSLMQGAVSGGIFGALSLAAVIGFVNISSSFLIGRMALPNIFYIKSKKRFLALGFLFSYIPLIIYINFALGVFRSMSQRAMETFSNEALQLATQKAAWPFPHVYQNTLESNALIIIGIIFAIISLIDGFFYDEPFPGYADKAKKAKSSKVNLDSIKKEGFEILRRQTAKGNSQITLFKEKRENANTRWANNIDSVQVLFTDYASWVKSLEEAANSLVDQYRAENIHYRSTEPPKYFSEPMSTGLDKDASHTFYSLASCNISDKEKEKSFNKANEIILSEYTQAIAELNQMYEDIMNQYQIFLRNL